MFDLKTIEALNLKAEATARLKQTKPLCLCDAQDLFYKIPASVPFVGMYTCPTLNKVETLHIAYADFKTEFQPAEYVSVFKNKVMNCISKYNKIFVGITSRSTDKIEVSIWTENTI